MFHVCVEHFTTISRPMLPASMDGDRLEREVLQNCGSRSGDGSDARHACAVTHGRACILLVWACKRSGPASCRNQWLQVSCLVAREHLQSCCPQTSTPAGCSFLPRVVTLSAPTASSYLDGCLEQLPRNGKGLALLGLHHAPRLEHVHGALAAWVRPDALLKQLPCVVRVTL